MLELNWEANKKRDSQSHNPGPSQPETPSDQHSQLLQGKLKFGEVTQSSLLEKKGLISTPAQRCQGVTNPPTLSPPCQGSGPHLCALCLYRSVETASGPHPSLSSLPANWCHWAGRVLGAVTDTVTCWVPDGTVRACFSPKRRDPALLLPLQCWLQLSLHSCSPPCPCHQGENFQTRMKAASCPLARQGEVLGSPGSWLGGWGRYVSLFCSCS